MIIFSFFVLFGWSYFFFTSPQNKNISDNAAVTEKNSAVTTNTALNSQSIFPGELAPDGVIRQANIPEPKKTSAAEILVGLEFQSSPDFKAFYQKYRQHTSPGIKYWVAGALEICLRFAKNPDGKPYESADDFLQSSVEGKQLADRTDAFNRLRNRCNGLEVSPAKETLIEMNALKTEAESGGDAKALAARGILIDNKYSDFDIARSVSGIFKSEDPYAVMELANLLQRPGLDYILIGANSHPVSYELVDAAAMLAACELGADCSRSSASWQSLCIDTGRCDSSGIARQVLDYLDSDADRFEAQRVHDLIVKAAKTGDVSLLGLPK
ncbi:MAG: hypothetical protein WCD07_03000 [Burkholderiales bacterium]